MIVVFDKLSFMENSSNSCGYLHEYVLKNVSFGKKECTNELKVWSVQFFWARLALGLISDPIMVSAYSV